MRQIAGAGLRRQILLWGFVASAPGLHAQQLGSSPDAEAALGLRAAVEMALERNRDLLVAEYEYRLATERVQEEWSGVFPEIRLNSSFTRNISPQVSFLPAQIFDPTAMAGEFIPVQFGADNLWSMSIDVDQVLFDPRVFVGLGISSAFERLQREALRGRNQEIVTRVKVAFFNLLLAQEELRLAEKGLDRVRESLAETRSLLRAGLADEYDVLRLEVELANLEPEVRRAENQRVAARRILSQELDLDLEKEVIAQGALAQMQLDDEGANEGANRQILSLFGVPDDVLEAGRAGAGGDISTLALEDRSDLRQLRITESIRRSQVRLDQAAYFPTVDAFARYGLQAQQNGRPDFFGTSLQRGSSKQVGLRVSMPIFSGFSRDARIDQASAVHLQAQLQTRLATDAARAQVRNLVDAVAEAGERTQGQAEAVRRATRGYEIASAQYGAGVLGRLELTDAELALRQSEFNYARAVYDYLSARARLDAAAGRVPQVDGLGTGDEG